MNSSLRRFAEDPPAYIPASPGATVVDEARFHLTVSADAREATACRLRLPSPVEPVFMEIAGLAPRARTEWVLGPSSTPADLEAQLRALGCREQDAPLTSHITALATDHAPPLVDGVEVRRVRTFADFLVGLDVSSAGWQLDRVTADRQRARAPETWKRRRARPGGEWVAFLDGQPAAYAAAIAGPHGLFLTGGVTLLEARGRGAYRALVRARWDEAVQRGTPALVVHAEEPSRRVLEAIGFERAGEIVELVSGIRA
jgi:hypothetical protein